MHSGSRGSYSPPSKAQPCLSRTFWLQYTLRRALPGCWEDGDSLDRTWALREDNVFVHICPVTQDSGWPGVLPWRRGLQSSWRGLRALVHSRASGTPDPSGPTRGGVSRLETIQARLQLAEAGAHGAGVTASSPDFQNIACSSHSTRVMG